LGGEPDFSPDSLASRSHAEYVEGESLKELIKEDLIAEPIAIETGVRATPAYRASPSELVRSLRSDDRSRRCQEWMLLTIW
jgi:bacterioferritin